MTSSPVGVVLRALPKAAALLLAVAALLSGRPFLVGLAAVVLLSQLATDWRGWAYYVRTGSRPAPVVPADFAEPGPCTIEIMDAGARRIDVIKAVREVSGADLVSAVRTVDSAPSVVCSQVSAASAARVSARLTHAGATTRIDPPIEA